VCLFWKDLEHLGVAAMDSFLDSIKHSVAEGLKKHSVVEGLKNLALEALHLNDHHQQEDNNADDPRPRPPAAVSPHSAAPSRSDWRHESAAGGGSNSWDSAGIQEPEARYESWNHGPGGGGAVQESHPERRRPPAAADSWAQVPACFPPLGVLPFAWFRWEPVVVVVLLNFSSNAAVVSSH